MVNKNMDDSKMILSLQERFGLSSIQANVIFYQLQEHFSRKSKTSHVFSDMEEKN